MKLPHNPPDGTPLQGILYLKEPDSDAFVAIPLEVDRYTLQQHTRIRRGEAPVHTNRMPIIVYGTALGIVENPMLDPFESTITRGPSHE